MTLAAYEAYEAYDQWEAQARATNTLTLTGERPTMTDHDQLTTQTQAQSTAAAAARPRMRVRTRPISRPAVTLVDFIRGLPPTVSPQRAAELARASGYLKCTAASVSTTRWKLAHRAGALRAKPKPKPAPVKPALALDAHTDASGERVQFRALVLRIGVDAAIAIVNDVQSKASVVL